jgi:hypothetical protein
LNIQAKVGTQDFRDSLAKSFKDMEDERDQFFGEFTCTGSLVSLILTYSGLSLREMIHEFKHQTLVLFKCLLLQPKVCFSLDLLGAIETETIQMLFFGSHCERLCMMQFSLISLIPGLIRNLEDCADPKFQSREDNMIAPTSLKTSERASCMDISTHAS